MVSGGSSTLGSAGVGEADGVARAVAGAGLDARGTLMAVAGGVAFVTQRLTEYSAAEPGDVASLSVVARFLDGAAGAAELADAAGLAEASAAAHAGRDRAGYEAAVSRARLFAGAASWSASAMGQREIASVVRPAVLSLSLAAGDASEAPGLFALAIDVVRREQRRAASSRRPQAAPGRPGPRVRR